MQINAIWLAGGAMIASTLMYLLRPYRSLMPSFVADNMSDGLWAYAGSLTLRCIWKYRTNEHQAWLCLFLTVAIAMELGQYLSLVPGTFDPFDLAAYGIGAGIGSFYPRNPLIT